MAVPEALTQLQQSRRGRIVLRLAAIVCLMFLTYPSILAIYLGLTTHWFYSFPEDGDYTESLHQFVNSASDGVTSEVVTTLLTAFPPIAFCLAYVGRKESRLSRFGLLLLISLLIGSVVGTVLSATIGPNTAQLICTDSNACVKWLANKCGESGRQCLTYFLLMVGFDKLTK
jgi:ABC-type Fe3+ transport system permease subunit